LRRYYAEHGKAPGAQALTDARATIAARAAFDGPEKEVFVRIARLDKTIYLDLGNEQWEAVEVTASGWRMMSSEAVPVKFSRKNNAASLPHPVTGVTIELLRRLLNVRTDEDFRLLVAWLIGALNPDGPYPVLTLQGIEARRLEVILLAVGGLATVALSRGLFTLKELKRSLRLSRALKLVQHSPQQAHSCRHRLLLLGSRSTRICAYTVHSRDPEFTHEDA
jgi:hypothetical protein